MNIKNKIKNKKVINTVQTTGLYDITLIMWRDNTLSYNELAHTNTIQKEKDQGGSRWRAARKI